MIELDDLRRMSLFDGSGDDQLAELARAGTVVPFAAGDVLFREGSPAESWWILLDGSVDLVRHLHREETVLGAMDVPGRWAGGFRAWDEHGVYLATGRAASRGRVLCIPSAVLRRLWATRFPLGLSLTEGVSRSARNYESMARQKEALAALGTLAAGLAHELNNPAAAATRAVAVLAQTHAAMLSALRGLAAVPVAADQFARIDELRRALADEPVTADPLDLADREDALTDWMERRGVAHGWTLASVLAGAGADETWGEQVAAVLGDAALGAALEWIAATLTAAGLMEEIRESTRRISDLVSAVKSYSQLDRASMQHTDVLEGLESTLVMLAHRIPSGVTVVREFETGIPRIMALAAELNQVWTNLVDNALDAMDGAGTLRVSARFEAGAVVVEIGDTGAGMTEEVRQHAFDPFFTTKGVGEGTGLGLDISRKIVDRHRGALSIDLRPGETVLQVRLPAEHTVRPTAVAQPST